MTSMKIIQKYKIGKSHSQITTTPPFLSVRSKHSPRTVAPTNLVLRLTRTISLCISR